MTEADLKKAIEIAEESTNGFADDGSFEHLLARPYQKQEELPNTQKSLLLLFNYENCPPEA